MQTLRWIRRSPRARFALNVATAAAALGVSLLVARHYAVEGWPLSNADPVLVAATGVLFLAGYAFKAYGWSKLFAPHERPHPFALAAAGGAASVTGIALPGRFDDVVRVAVVRRHRGCPAGVRALALSLFTLGLIDTVALTPLASSAAAVATIPMAIRVGLAVVAGAGIGAALLILALPRIGAHRWFLRFRIARWLGEHSPSPRDSASALVLVLTAWLVRSVGLFLLLGAFGIGLSFPLALVFLCAGAASAALPIAPAGAATQAGAGAAILVAAGVDTPRAVAFAVGSQALVMMAGAAVLLVVFLWQASARLVSRPVLA